MLCLVIDLIDPKILWHVDFWKYKGDKPEPSGTYLLVNRIFAGIGLLVMLVLFNSHLR